MAGSKREGNSGAKKQKFAVAQKELRRVGRPKGKRSDPEYERLTVLVRKDTRKAAVRLWEDLEPNRDMSELVQKLLGEWLKGNAK